MFKFLKQFYKNASEEGLRVPFVYDSLNKVPSITLLFAYITFVLMTCSLVALHFYKQLLEATTVSIFVWIIATVFYRLRQLDKVDLNIKTGNIELEDDSKEEKDSK